MKLPMLQPPPTTSANANAAVCAHAVGRLRVRRVQHDPEASDLAFVSRAERSRKNPKQYQYVTVGMWRVSVLGPRWGRADPGSHSGAPTSFGSPVLPSRHDAIARQPSTIVHCEPHPSARGASPDIRRRAYVWEIVLDGPEKRLMRRSTGSFRSMEEAPSDGMAALASFRRLSVR